MTTPDPALAAALDRLMNCSRLVGKTMALSYSGGRSELLAQEAAARAAVVACAAPARVTEGMVDRAAEAIWASILGPRSNVPWDRQPRDVQARYRIAARAALEAALDGEPEDAGAKDE